MGCGEACPFYPGKRYEDWPVDDPSGQDLDTVRTIIDDIDARARGLVADLLPDHVLPAAPGLSRRRTALRAGGEHQVNKLSRGCTQDLGPCFR